MTTLESQYRQQIRGWSFAIKERGRRLANRILRDGLEIFRGWVPINTELLKQNIIGEIHEIRNYLEVRIHIKDVSLPYDTGIINAIVLGLKLEAGKDGYRLLRRSRDNTYAQARTSTAAWFDNASRQWMEVAERAVQLQLLLGV